MPTAWIDFKELRRKLRIADVLRHYQVEFKVKGDRATALCPLPDHPIRTDGRKRTASLSIHLGKGIWQCFGCKKSGNAVDLWSLLSGLDPANPAEFRQAAIKAAEAFYIRCNDASPTSHCEATSASKPATSAVADDVDEACDNAGDHVIVNAPLDFTLKHLDPNHPYLPARGFTPETISHFGLGSCSRGMLKDRIAIPLHDPQGQLVGYAGRLVDDAGVSEDCPKYLFPGVRQREGKRHEFHKSELLYNFHRIVKPADRLVLVEGFASVWWLHQHHCPNVVALMGSSISSVQATLILDLLNPSGRLLILPDPDEAGERCAADVLHRLSPHRWCRWIQAQGQPTELSAPEILRMHDMGF